MSDDTIDRVALLEGAMAIEAAGGDWTVSELAAVLGCSRRTVYETPWLMRISRRVGKRGRRWNPKEVRTAQAIASGRDVLKRTGS